MADRNDAPLSMVASSGGGTGHAHAAGAAERNDGSVVTEFMDAARSAAESLLEEQKRQIADRISGVGEALRGAAKPLDRSQNRIVARYLEAAAGQVEGLSSTMRQRRWSELVADAEEFARRNPTLFVASCVAIGFVVGRLLWTSSAGRQQQAAWSSSVGEPARSVTAAVASSSGTAIGSSTGTNTAHAGAAEAR